VELKNFLNFECNIATISLNIGPLLYDLPLVIVDAESAISTVKKLIERPLSVLHAEMKL